MTTTAELTEKYIGEHPSIRDCLKKDIINYSELARRIGHDLKIERKASMEAISVACRRYAAKLGRDRIVEDRVMEILKKSELEIKNKIVVVIIDKKIYRKNLSEMERKIQRGADIFYVIEGTRVFTIIISEKHLEELNALFMRDIIKTSKNLAMITIKSPEDLETTPGVVSHLYSIFSEHGINIVETMSCWTDTIFVVSENDIPLAMKYLRF